MEFGPFDLPYCEGDEDTVLLLAGDIGTQRIALEVDAVLIQAAEQFKEVIYIPGNHEFYGGEYPGTWDRKVEHIKKLHLDNVLLIDQGVVKVGEYLFIGATMWTALDETPGVRLAAEWYMNDYRMATDTITKGKLTTWRTIVDHKQAVEYIFGMCKWARYNKLIPVVMTHHAPAHGSIAPEFKGDELNGAYFTDLEYRITEEGPVLWVHGHMHNKFDYMVGDTRVVTNPRGYVMGERENKDFDPEFTLEV